MKKIAVLFARKDSIYKSIGDLDVFDIHRDARNFNDSCPVIAHPPCRGWGRLSHMAKPRPDELSLAHFAVLKVRENGGVLEHPEFSKLWLAAKLPLPGSIDEFGGFTLPLPQFWFGHLARKNTWLYIVGIAQRDLPNIPLVLGESRYVVSSSKRNCNGAKKEIPKKMREETPVSMALWLVKLCSIIGDLKCQQKNVSRNVCDFKAGGKS
jgi:hypothetical protein